MMKQIFLLVFLLCSVGAFSQKVSIKNNLAYDALKTPNLSLEFSMGRKWTLDTQVGMNFFFYENDATANGYKTKKWSHWLQNMVWNLKKIQGIIPIRILIMKDFMIVTVHIQD